MKEMLEKKQLEELLNLKKIDEFKKDNRSYDYEKLIEYFKETFKPFLDYNNKVNKLEDLPLPIYWQFLLTYAFVLALYRLNEVENKEKYIKFNASLASSVLSDINEILFTAASLGPKASDLTLSDIMDGEGKKYKQLRKIYARVLRVLEKMIGRKDIIRPIIPVDEILPEPRTIKPYQKKSVPTNIRKYTSLLRAVIIAHWRLMGGGKSPVLLKILSELKLIEETRDDLVKIMRSADKIMSVEEMKLLAQEFHAFLNYSRSSKLF